MDLMNNKRINKLLKEREGKESSRNKTTESRLNQINNSSYEYESTNYRKEKSKERSRYDGEGGNMNRNKRTVDYIAIKREKEQREFEERGEIYNRMKEKDRKDGILKQLKSKVREQRMNLLNNTK